MQENEAKPVSYSAIEDHVYKIFPNDLNSNDTVFGGLVMSMLDRVAVVVAERHSGQTCVTASVDALHFLAPAHRGDILVFQGAVNRSWRSSMEIGLRVFCDDPHTGKRTHIVSAYFTFVAIDKTGKTVAIPAIIPQTDDEIRRFEEAELRRATRKQQARQRHKNATT